MEYAYEMAFGSEQKFNTSKSYNGTFVLPFKGDDSKRSVYVNVANLEVGLDLQLIVTCDSSLVVGYALPNDLNADSKEKPTKTDNYSCGDKVRIKEASTIAVVLIQNTGTSTVTYEVKKYESFLSTPAGIGALVGGIIGGLILIGLGIFFYRRYKAKKLAEELGHGPLI